MKKLIILLVIAANVWAFTEEEKPCGHAHDGSFLSHQMFPSSEQNKIDINYYRLNFDMNIFNRTMRNEYTIKLTVLDSSLSAIELDYSTDNLGVGDITVTLVTLDGDTVDYTHSQDLLRIPLTDVVMVGQKISVFVKAWTTSATRRNDQGFNWDTARMGVYTNSQPYDARDWWPCVDYPRDKADSVDIFVTFNDVYTVASNGKLMSTIDNGNNTKTWHWHVGHPIATYLVSLSIYDFYEWGMTWVSADQDSLPIKFYTYSPPENPSPSYMATNYRLLPEMLTLYEEQFGPYPFMDEKYGHAEWGENYGMEHQTLTSMGDPTERRVAHELAHMWFGDMITCDTYNDIWLNEGFATYAEALWWERKYGPSGYKTKIKSFEYFGNGTIYVENPEVDNIFYWSLSYAKAAYVLHMLRHVVGDESFFEILQTYADDPEIKHKTATTEQFKSVCEEVSGRSLDNFFQQWIYGSLFPQYAVYWAQSDTELLIETTQTSTVFDMPVDFRVTTTNLVIDTVLMIDQKDMQFYLQLPDGEKVTGLVLDPDDWLLNTTTYVVGVNDEDQVAPSSFKLKQNYPNPFNPSTRIDYSLEEPEQTRISIIDIKGNELLELVNSKQEAGQHQIVWNSTDRFGNAMAAGVYFCKLESGPRSAVIKLLLVR
ncbi:MAG: T9SS type A sorting domain-containing protein [Candidatus Marinimicrobia bacterium]|nr:T9SS type A sorting domain-containing protein [Candidatus Neomarinimicrobiota bacterium]